MTVETVREGGIYRERLPAHCVPARELVLLHGWSASSDCWRSALPRLRRHFNVTLIDLPGHGGSLAASEYSVDGFLRQLLPLLPEQAIYLGWSLGAMLAGRLAADFPERVTALISVAGNANFVQCPGWANAMAPEVFQDFRQRFARNPQRALRRFDALQQRGGGIGDESTGGAGGFTRPGANLDGLRHTLNWLGELDNRAAIAALTCPHLAIFGDADALVPLAAAASIAALNPASEICVFDDSGHLPFLSRADEFWQTVLDFCQRTVPLEDGGARVNLDKRSIAASFSRAAASYDRVADLQRRVADALLAATLAGSGDRGLRVLDLGCGTGYSVPALRPLASQLLALDLAEGMLNYARRQPERSADAWLCGDAEDLPLADDSLDLVFSSLSVQWCENLAAVFAEAYRVLKPGGRLVLSTLGPDTLRELRQAWRAVDDRAHVNRFLNRDEVSAALAGSGLELLQWDECEEVLRYRELKELMAELKQLGAHNLNAGRPSGLTGKRALRNFVEAYEPFRTMDGLLPASYQVWYLQLCKPEQRLTHG